MTLLRVTYMELRERPPLPPARQGPERIALETPSLHDYLALYRKVGAPLGWDQRLQMPEKHLAALLDSGSLSIYVLRSEHQLGFCEFDHLTPEELEIKNFGLIPEAQGRGLGSWLLRTAIHQAWQSNTQRIWLHTDTWDHASAIGVYERAGFKIYAVREEEAGPL